MKKNITKLGLIAALLVAPTTAIKAQEKCSLGVSSSVKSAYVGRPGFIIDDSAVNQNAAVLSCGKFTGVLWSNKNIELGKTTENDFIVRYGFNISDSIKGRIGYDRWNFPQANSGVDIFEAGIHHSGILESDLSYTHDLTNGGLMIHGSLEKEIHSKNKLNIHLGVSSVYVNDFFGSSGITQITPKIKFSYDINDNLSINASLNKQFGFKDQKNKNHANLGINYQF